MANPPARNLGSARRFGKRLCPDSSGRMFDNLPRMPSRGVLSLTVLVLGLGASALPAGAADVPGSLAAALQDELGRGGSVAVLGSYDGLIALSVDGKRRRTLVPGQIFGVRVDNRSEVIWYRADRTGTTSDL